MNVTESNIYFFIHFIVILIALFEQFTFFILKCMSIITFKKIILWCDLCESILSIFNLFCGSSKTMLGEWIKNKKSDEPEI